MTAHSSSFRGLIFDLDGTLIDSAPDIASAVNSFFLSRGWPQQETTFIERFIGNGPRRLLLDIMIELGLPHDVATVDAAVLAYIENYTRYPARYTRFYKHVKEDLQTLREAGFEPIPAGSLEEGARFDPGSPFFNNGMRASELKRALSALNRA